MRASDSTVASIFSSRVEYIIPEFQRGYCWEKEKWETLWTDILSVAESSDQRPSHFIGPLILITQVLSGNVVQFMVVDGQQRLVTLTMLFCALRDVAKEENLEAFSKSIESELSFIEPSTGHSRPKLLPRLEDKNTFSGIVIENSNNLIDKDSLVYKCFTFFRDKTREHLSSPDLFNQKSPLDQLEGLYTTIMQRLRLVKVDLDDSDNPTQIFESLNFKGEKLSEADLIRNFIFMQIPLSRHKEFDNQYWTPFENLLRHSLNGKAVEDFPDELTDFYYRYLISNTEYFPRQALYPTFVRYIKDIQKRGNKNLDLVANDLRRYMRYYINIVKLQEKNNQLLTAFKRFGSLEVKTAIPLLLHLYSRYDQNSDDSQNKLSLQDFCDYLKVIESYVLRRAIFRMSSRQYGSIFARAIHESQSKDQMSKFLLSTKWPNDEDIKQELRTFPIYHHEPGKTRLILKEIELSLSGKEVVAFENLTIEHVLPQDLNRDWKNALGANAPSIHNRLRHVLGNLTLTAENSKLGQKPFLEKRKILRESKVQLNRYFDALGEWKEDEINARSQILAEEFVKIWAVPKSITSQQNKKSNAANQISLEFSDL